MQVAQLVLAGGQIVAAAARLELGGRAAALGRGFAARALARPRACWRGRRRRFAAGAHARRRRSARARAGLEQRRRVQRRRRLAAGRAEAARPGSNEAALSPADTNRVRPPANCTNTRPSSTRTVEPS